MVDTNKLVQISHERSKYIRMEIIKEIISDWKVYGSDMEQLETYKGALKEIKEISRIRNLSHISQKLLGRKMQDVYNISREALTKEPVMRMNVKKAEYEFHDGIEYKINDAKLYEELLAELDLIIEYANLDEEHIAILKDYFYDTLVLGKEEVKTYAK